MLSTMTTPLARRSLALLRRPTDLSDLPVLLLRPPGPQSSRRRLLHRTLDAGARGASCGPRPSPPRCPRGRYETGNLLSPRPSPHPSGPAQSTPPRSDGAEASSVVVRRDIHGTAVAPGPDDDDPSQPHPSSDAGGGNLKSSPFATTGGGGGGLGENPPRRTRRPRKKFVPTRAAVQLTPESRRFFRSIIANHSRDKPETVGVMLRYQQASTGQPRMVFSFNFVSGDEVGEYDEGVSLEVLDDGVTPKPPSESEGDGLPKLYVDQNAFLKVLGATVALSEDDGVPYLLDKEGNRLDPNV